MGFSGKNTGVGCQSPQLPVDITLDMALAHQKAKPETGENREYEQTKCGTEIESII